MISPLYLSDGSMIYVADDGRDSEGRVKFVVQVRAADGRVLHTEDDIRSGVNAPVDHAAGLESFSAFLGAWVEAQGYPDSENADLFPPVLLPWAEANEGELWTLTHEDES